MTPAPTTCQRCGTALRPGIALAQTWIGGTPDFPGDTHASTFSAGGPGRVVQCEKCPDCGWSITGAAA